MSPKLTIFGTFGKFNCGRFALFTADNILELIPDILCVLTPIVITFTILNRRFHKPRLPKLTRLSGVTITIFFLGTICPPAHCDVWAHDFIISFNTSYQYFKSLSKRFDSDILESKVIISSTT